MSLRAVILGLVGVAFVCSYTYFNDWIMRQTMFVGNFMPISVYGFLVLFLAFLYPVLSRLHRGLALKPGEIAVILGMVLASCAIPGSNLLRLFTPALIMPHRFEKTEPGWQKQGIMELLPDGMLADISQDEETVLSGFTRGLGEGDERIAWSDVPWQAWAGPMIFWIPIILSLWLAMVGLSTVVHRQWSDHEHLPYPIVTFTKSLFPSADGERSPVFSNRIFWIGLIAVFSIHFYNYLNTWFSDYLLGRIPLGVDYSSLATLSDTFAKGGGELLLRDYFTLYFTVIAVAYFLPKDVSLSLGIGPFLWIFVAGTLATYGIGATGWQGGWPFGLTRESMMIMGAYFAMLLVLIYTGRHYYSTVFKRAFGLGGKDRIESSAVWGARVFLVSLTLFVTYTAIHADLDWPIALLFGLGCVAVYLVMSRLLAETGLFFIVTTGTPATILWALFGAHALGPQIMLILFMFCLVLFYDTREALMPYVVNALKLADDTRQHVGKMALAISAAVLVGLAVGIPVTLYFQYYQGVDVSSWQVNQTKVPFNDVIGIMQRLESQGQLETAGQATGLSRFMEASPNRQALLTFVISAGLVLIFSGLRLRFANWPLHPVMFLVWSTYAGNAFAQSFLIGWLIKMLITKYGGAAIYQRFKPLMFGLIAGEMLGGGIPMMVSLIYFLFTGDPPKPFLVMPG
ncbi:MAG TPA: hypothetical protein PKE26_05605 [Kiritimatiellia bacterium]|nr:hypothetical protein [Kiritimatiellia bacterium]HMO98568.1 hypothetical protein [Kiritimatiellia bacterium]HMP95453.1 hypothetical protein [Kiritimatiellia bacterium]